MHFPRVCTETCVRSPDDIVCQRSLIFNLASLPLRDTVETDLSPPFPILEPYTVAHVDKLPQALQSPPSNGSGSEVGEERAASVLRAAVRCKAPHRAGF